MENFLEWYSLNQNNLYFNASGLLMTGEEVLFSEIADFYLQPFKPEMITELFWGWFTYQNGYSNHKDEIIVFSDEIRVFVAHKEGTDKFQNNFLFPLTLNDFISDCQRAGISLEWKKEIADKYFGGVK